MKGYFLFYVNTFEVIVSLILGGLFGLLTYSNWGDLALTFIIGALVIMVTAIIVNIPPNYKMKKLLNKTNVTYEYFINAILRVAEEKDKIEKEKRMRDLSYYLRIATNACMGKTLPNENAKNIFNLIDAILRVAEEKDEIEKEKKIRDLSYYIELATDSCTGKALLFEPNSAAINMLHEVNGTISITAAMPREWLNPTFNFFLIKNYISSIKHQVNSHGKNKTMKFSENRNVPPFVNFGNRKKKIVEDLSKLNIENPSELKDYLLKEKICIRFYILSIEEIQNNKPILETLVAGHELFGCYLYIIIDGPRFQGIFQDLKKFLSVIGYDFEGNDNKTDLMIAQRDGGIDVVYRKEDTLQQNEIKDPGNQSLIQKCIKKIGQYVSINYDDSQYVFNCSTKFPLGFIVNNQYPHVYVERI